MDNLIFLPIVLRYQSIKLLRLYLSLITLIKLPFNSIHNFANLSIISYLPLVQFTVVSLTPCAVLHTKQTYSGNQVCENTVDRTPLELPEGESRGYPYNYYDHCLQITHPRPPRTVH